MFKPSTSTAFSALASLVLTLVLAAPAMAQFQLQILHAADQEGDSTAVADAPNFAAIFDNLEETYPNTIAICSGDLILPGSFFSAGADSSVQDELRDVLGNEKARTAGGRPDIAINEIVGFQAVTFGNHEFDQGISTLEELIMTDLRDGGDNRWFGTQWPYLSANLDFSASALADVAITDIRPWTDFLGDASDVTAAAAAPKIAPATYIMVDGEMIGIVGATTPTLGTISSPGDVTIKDPGAGQNDMALLATHIQPYVDQLIAMGANKIILQSHLQQIQLEEQLVGQLTGVDIVLAGGSDTILADSEDIARGLRPGDNEKVYKSYPIQTTNKAGEPAIIINTDGQYKYVGRLVVSFDDNGVLDLSSIDPVVSGAFATTDAGVAALWGSTEAAFADASSKGAKVKKLADAVGAVLVQKDSVIYGKTDVYLEGERSFVRQQETNLGNLSSKAMLWKAQQSIDSTAVCALRNGGGIRASIGEIVVTPGTTGEYDKVPPQYNALSGKQEGEVSQLDVENTLRFNNTIHVLTLSATDLKEIVESGIDTWAPDVTSGSFPQVAGMRFSFDPSLDGMARIRSLAIVDADGEITDTVVENGEVVGDAERTFRIATLSYLAGGGDGYPFDTLGEDEIETEVGEQEALAEYMAAFHSETPYAEADKPMAEDENIQNLSVREDTVLSGDDDSDGCVYNPKGSFGYEWLLLLVLPALLAVFRRARA